LLYNFLADLVVILHCLFVLFVLLGGILAVWKSCTAWCHIPAVLWAACTEFFGWVCPLTPLENLLREKGGIAGYDAGFVEHYLVPVIYPVSLTRDTQIYLGIIVVIVNIGIYFAVWVRMVKGGRDKG
jgi:hypothetical protein